MQSSHSSLLPLGLFIAALALLGAGCPPLPPPLPPGVIHVQDQVYARTWTRNPEDDGEKYILRRIFYDRLYSEEFGGVLKPAVVMLHGGSFVQGSKEDPDQFRLAKHLATQGYVCFLIEYRLKGDQPPAPAPYNEDPVETVAHAATVDAKAALRYVRAKAADFEVDPDSIAILGASAGAIAALGAGLSAPGEFASDGPDFPIPEGNHPDVDPTPQVLINLWGSGDHVLDRIDADAPLLFIAHGEDDEQEGVEYEAAHRLADAYDAAGAPYVFYSLPGFGHGAWEAEVDGVPLNDLILNFLDEYLW